MLQRFFLGAAMVGAFAGIVRASAQDDINAALQKLADSPSYSWKTTTEGGFGAGETDGKTQKDGPTTLLTITRQDNTYQVIIQGDKAAAKTDDGWKSTDELTAATAAGGQGGGAPGPERILSMTIQNFKTPVAIAQAAVAGLQNIQQSNDVYAADLSDDAAKQALTFRRRPQNADASAAPANAPTVSNAKATVKIWIADGAVSKIENHVTGTVSFNGNDRDIDRTTTTVFSDVGSTVVAVPDDAKAKLTAPAAAPTTQP
jgi:hypothetical protein